MGVNIEANHYSHPNILILGVKSIISQLFAGKSTPLSVSSLSTNFDTIRLTYKHPLLTNSLILTERLVPIFEL